jgi:hypothetical protein
MTFLLFLASLVVLEFLVRDTKSKSSAAPKMDSTGPANVIDPRPAVAETATSDLLALGQALNANNDAQSIDLPGVPGKVKAESGVTQP